MLLGKTTIGWKTSVVVQSLSCVRFLVTSGLQTPLSFTSSRVCSDSMMPSNHLILCHPLLLLPSVFPSIRVFANKSAVHISWPKYWSFSFTISPSSEYSGLISFRMGFPSSSAGKKFTCNAGDPGLIPRLERSIGEGIDYPFPVF